MTAKQVNVLVIDLLKDLVAAGPETAGATVVAFFAGHEAESRKWPTDAEVRAALQLQPLYTAITRARLRMVLEAIEDRLRTPLSDEQHCARGAYTIEHVLPQGWGQYWPLPAGEAELLTLERDRAVQRLGNLTLVNNKLNPSLSNRPWTDAEAQAIGYDFGKRSLLQQHGTLHMNTRIVTGWADRWDEECIAARGEKLADLVLTIWPGADAFVAELAG